MKIVALIKEAGSVAPASGECAEQQKEQRSDAAQTVEMADEKPAG